MVPGKIRGWAGKRRYERSMGLYMAVETRWVLTSPRLIRTYSSS